MKWIKDEDSYRIPVKSWCADLEAGALKQAENLARHPVLAHHVALMPDCHLGYGMSIGGVIATKDAVIPSAVGVDIGCGMIALETGIPAKRFVFTAKERRAPNWMKSASFPARWVRPATSCAVSEIRNHL